MQVELAKTAGFCFGVKRAVETVYQEIEKHEGGPIYTYGPIIHNDEVIRDLKSQGVRVLGTREDLESLDHGTVIIRSHGVPESVCKLLKDKGIRYVGNSAHPEVMGIRGWAAGPVDIIQDAGEAEKFSLENEGQKVCVVAQTTFNYNKFQELVEIITKKGYDIIVLNTICNATKERQEEASGIASRVGAMIVIGDRKSSNTQKLFEICSNACENTYYIQTLGDLNVNQLRSVESVGITAGASTPNKIIEEVQNYVRINF